MRNLQTGFKRRELTAEALAAHGLLVGFVPLHGDVAGTDTATAVVMRDPSNQLAGPLTIQGSAAGAWANPGWYTPSATGYVNSATAEAASLMDTTNSVALLMSLNLWHTGDPSAEINFLESGINNSAASNGGGFGIRMGTDGAVVCITRAPDTGTSITGWIGTKDATALTSQRLVSTWLVDPAAKTLSHYWNGSHHVTNSASAAPPTVRIRPPANWGVTIGARRNTTVLVDRFAGAGGNGVRLSNVWIMNDTTGIILNNMVRIAADLAERPNQVPRELLRLVGL